jgi:hypothetical protein
MIPGKGHIGRPRGNDHAFFGMRMAEKNELSAQYPEIAARLKNYITIGYREPRSQKDDGKYTGKPKK